MAAPIDDMTFSHKEKHDDVFKAHFKYYKKRNPFPNLEDVLDFTTERYSEVRRIQLITPTTPQLACLKPVEEWNVFTHELFPGFTFIQNPFWDDYQSYWAHRCITEYPMKPNITNLDAHMNIDPSLSIWHESTQNRRITGSFKNTLMYKLRWVTLGYHHDWNTKKYDLINTTPFPEDMQILFHYIGVCLGWPQYKAEAAIVNYYHLDSTLAGHTDHSELDHQSPLVSISFGQTALFMLGGPTKATPPITMYLRSGDIAVMEGPARLSYHAIPKILPGSCDITKFLEVVGKLTECSKPKDCTYSMSVNPTTYACERSGRKDCTQSTNDNPTTHSCECSTLTDCMQSTKDNPTNHSCECSTLTDCMQSTKDNHTNHSCECSTQSTNHNLTTHSCEPSTRKDHTENNSDNPTIYSCATDRLNHEMNEVMASIDKASLWEYLKTSRINMNVRQVLPESMTFSRENKEVGAKNITEQIQ